MYERCQGVTKDRGRARSWYQAAAEKGNVKAIHNLVVSLSSGGAGTADYSAAARWYAEAAAYGLTDSQFNLGVLSEHGLGFPKNLSDAYQWFALAAAALATGRAGRRGLETEGSPRPRRTGSTNDPNAEGSAAPNTALVTRAQNLLNKLGYDAGMADGLMGAQTRDAIKSFERKNGLEETGKVTIPWSPSSSA